MFMPIDYIPAMCYIKRVINLKVGNITMTKKAQTKEQPKEAKQPRKPVSWKAVIRKWLAKPAAYVALFTLAAYGCRHLLATISEPASVAITSLMIAALVYIILVED